MFGYIRTDIPNLYMKDNALYKSLYCGTCKAIKKVSGERGRYALSYDVVLFSALFHNVTGVDVKITKQHCVIHPFRKRPMTEVTPLDLRIGCLNTILAYYKLKDSVKDDGKAKIATKLFKKAYKKAKKKEPLLDGIVAEETETLAVIEEKQTPSVDMSADPFANLVKRCAKALTDEFYTEELGELCYFIGKWIYIIDALDDYDKDVKKKSYNPFYFEYKSENGKELIKKNGEEIRFIFRSVLDGIKENTEKISFKFNADLVKNILLSGMPKKTDEIFRKYEQ